MTSESTARRAHELGFNVVVAVDFMTDMDPEPHQNSVTRIFPEMSETGTTHLLLDLLKQHSWEDEHRLERSVSLAGKCQLPNLGGRRGDLERRYVDAAHRAGL